MKFDSFPDELQQYIKKIHSEPYKFPSDTCIHKNLKVARKAQEMGLSSDVMLCFAQTPKWMRWIYPYNPHLYLVIEGVKIDLFYAQWWGTERVTKCRVKLYTLQGKK